MIIVKLSYGHAPDNALRIGQALLPDILDYDYSSPKGYAALAFASIF
jgi:hypothetical protein